MQDDTQPSSNQGSDDAVLAANAARTQVNQALDGEKKDTNPYHRTHQDNFDWTKYHSAWQQYYQRYYHDYYQQQLFKERQNAHGERVEAATKTGEDDSNIQKTVISKLKNDITETVKERAKKIRRSHHFIPIVSALLVGAGFLFLQFNGILIAQVKAYVSPGNISDEAVVLDPLASINVGPKPKLIIPKINVDVPVDYNVGTLDESQIQVSLRDGATHYKLPGANAMPGQKGNTVILGHSSNDIFNQGAYKFVFVLLDRMSVGDTFYLHYKGTRYIYRVTDKKVIDPHDVTALQLGTSKPRATLVTCTPPGTALNRLLIIGEQISPDPLTAKAANKPHSSDQNEAPLPGDGQSILQSIWDFFF